MKSRYETCPDDTAVLLGVSAMNEKQDRIDALIVEWPRPLPWWAWIRRWKLRRSIRQQITEWP
jgi:hypothetical protein